MSSDIDVKQVAGWTAPGFEAVERAFARLVGSGAEPGGHVEVWQRGAPVVQLTGGTIDVAGGSPWTEQTLVQVYSTGKPFAALAALSAVHAGLLTLDDPVCTWWPEYGVAGKHATTLRDVLSHRAGQPAFPADAAHIPPPDKAALITALASAAPESVPGVVIAEHAQTYGHLIDGLLAAVGAPDIAAFSRTLADRLGIQLRFGLDADECEHAAELEVVLPGWTDGYRQHDLGARALDRPGHLQDPQFLNSEAWRRSSFPAIGLHTDARSLARFYDDIGHADGVVQSMLGDGLFHEFRTAQAVGFDAFVRDDVAWSLGMRVDGGEYGMGGLGGSAGWYSQPYDYSMAYVTRGLGDHARVDELADAVEEALAR